MSGFKLAAFAGFSPRVSPTLLQDNEAQKAHNTKLLSGELRAWNKPGSVFPKAQTVTGVLSIYKHLLTDGSDHWLSWDTDVNVARGPIYGNGDNPIYMTGWGNKPRKTNSALAGVASYHNPQNYYDLGLPSPVAAPSVSASGGTTGGGVAAEERVYLCTFLSQFGNIVEESAPSPVSNQVTVNYGGTVSITGLPASVPAGWNTAINKVRIYRSVTGTNATTFLKVADVSLGTTSYSDTVTASGLGVSLPSSSWTAPPDDLSGLIAMPNGFLVGFRANEIWFSEPYFPHAWPIDYMLSVEFPIVGIAAMGESIVVMTKGTPFVVTGTSPASMSSSKLSLYEPCVSKRSIASDEGGVLYASPNGIVKIAAGFAGLSTRALFTRDEWANYTPSSMLGTVLDGRYYLFYQSAVWNTTGALILDRNESASPLTEVSLYTTAVHTEPTTAALFVADGGEVKKWEGDTYSFLPYEWKSKLFIFNRACNYGAAQVEADFGNISLAKAQQALNDQAIAANKALFNSGVPLLGTLGTDGALNTRELDGSILKSLVSEEIDNRYITLTVYANGKQVAAIQVRDSNPFRLPSGFKSDRWEFQLSGNIPIRHLKVAETSVGLIDV